MPKVQLGKGGNFVNIKDACTHGTLYIVDSGVYRYALCRHCGKNIGEVEKPNGPQVQGKGKKGS